MRSAAVADGASDDRLGALRRELEARIEELGAILDTAPVGIWVARDPACAHIEGNRAAKALLDALRRELPPGASETEPTAPLRVLRDGAALALDDLPLHRTVRTATPIVGEELELVAGETRRMTLVIDAVPLFAPDGTVRGGIATAIDVTARKRTEDDLRHASALLGAIVETASDLVFAKDRLGRLRLANRATLEVIGKPADEVLGRSDLEFHPIPEEATRIMAFDQAVMASGAAASAEEHFTGPDGTRVYLSTKAPLRNDDGEVIGLVGTAHDITERKRAEDMLVEHRALLELIARDVSLDECLAAVCAAVARLSPGARACVLAVDAEGRTLVRAVGVALPPAFVADLCGPVSVAAPGAALASEDVGGDERWSREWRERCALLGIRACHGTPIEGEGRSVGCLILCFGEARAATAHERRIGVFGAQVAGIALARDRTHRALRDTLAAAERARSEAEHANHAKDEFLAMLGHELRNPLAAVRNAVTTASLDAHRRDAALAIAHRQTEQLAWLVDDLLDVARITQGRIALRREATTLQAIVARAVETTRDFIEARGHDLVLDLPPRPVAVDGDPGRLEQVVVNLLSNSAKYTDPGGQITVTVAHDGADAVVRVRDTGIGIAAEMLPHVFDLFAQSRRGLDRTQGGLGIGLTVVRRLVELHGGRIVVASPGLGHGAEFLVRLPALDAPPERTPAAPRRAPAEGVPARVLMVEDNPDAAESLQLLLETLGHRVRVAHHGLAALEAARTSQPDVMLVDIGLPGMDGYEVARRIRQDPAFGTPVLVALTGYGREEDKRAAMAAGFDHHLVKPIDTKRLQQLLRDAVARPGTDDTA